MEIIFSLGTWLMLVILGASLGSFTHAAGLRILSQEDPIRTPSRCRSCNQNLSWVHLIPIFSWLIQRGRCACKKLRISPMYLIFEVFFAGIVSLTWLTFPWQEALGLSLFYVLLGICFTTDIYNQELHLPTMLFLLATGLVFQVSTVGLDGLLLASLSAILGFGLIWLTNGIYKLVRKQDGFGNGDTWLLAAIGAWTTPSITFGTFLLAAWLGAIYGIASIALGKGKLNSTLPFGVFLSLAVILLIHTPWGTR